MSQSRLIRPANKLTFIGRNILLLSLLIDGEDDVSGDSLWNIYYHFYLDGASVDIVLNQTEKLLVISESLDDWNKSPHGQKIKFCDSDTLRDVRRIWKAIRNAAQDSRSGASSKLFEKNLRSSREIQEGVLGKDGVALTAMRSAAPLSLKSTLELGQAFRHYWKNGTVTSKDAKTTVPNPMFAGLISEREILHYATDPLLGYHLATAFTPLADTSPLKPSGSGKGVTAEAAARTQFNEWVTAFRAGFVEKVVLRFVVSEALTFCHGLQNAAAVGTRPNLYRRQWDSRPLDLNEVYSKQGTAPTEFDMIDTSNLEDHLGTLNILVAAGPLLKNEPWASLCTERLISYHASQQHVFDNVLCGDGPTVSLLLGFSPVQYWTNAKCESHVDEYFLSSVQKGTSSEETQLRSRLVWKRDDQFSGQSGGRGRLHISAAALARVVFQIYQRMFETENLRREGASTATRRSSYPHFHRGSLAALLKLIMTRVQTDWSDMCSSLFQKISEDRTLTLATNQMQELGAQIHLMGVNTEAWIINEPSSISKLGGFHAWSSIPPVVAVTMLVPRQSFTRLFVDTINHKMASPALAGSLRAGSASANQWHNMFGDVHIVFGNIKETHSRSDDDFKISIEQDVDGWSGDSPLIASFYVPTAALQVEPKSSLVGLCVPPSGQSTMLYGPILGLSMTVFETRVDNEAAVFVTRFMPGQDGYPAICAGVKPLENVVNKGEEDKTTKLIAEVPDAETTIATITGHLDITSQKGKDLLQKKVPIELRQAGPFVIDIVFGRNQIIRPLRFPMPVTITGSRTRIARTSGYIEVIAPLAKAGMSDALGDFVFPATLSTGKIPATLNTPHLNLDRLPILDIKNKEDVSWLTSLTSLIFSYRERQLRTRTNAQGISDDPRVNFKESLFTIFMVSSGLQGGQTGMFAINHPEKGGIHMLIFVSAFRLDGDTGSVVVDAAVIPCTLAMIESGKMTDFLMILRTLECGTLNVNDAELELWKKVLPSWAERCRTWSHGHNCEYKRANATIPLSVRDGQQLLCSCGNGKLPENFVSLPEWDSAAANAVRIAISPTYAVPFVEEVIDPKGINHMTQTKFTVEKCRNCGKTEEDVEGALKKCLRCLKVKYCSAACQKKDWKKHRMECEEAK